MGVVFFPSFPFMGVMLFPSLVLENASGESVVLKEELLVLLSPFSPLLPSLLPLSLLSSPFPSPFLFLEIFPVLRELLVLFIPKM